MSDDSLFELLRPAYTVPTLAETLTRDNGLTAVSTFSGCGGSSLGLHQAGWRIPYAVEFIPAAAVTYAANYPATYVDRRDVRDIAPNEILTRLGLNRGELDLLEGSPPCSSFSVANTSTGSRYGAEKVKNYSENVYQVTDDLFDEWLRLVDGLNPRAVLAENVPGLVSGADARPFYLTILRRLYDMGYSVAGGIYNAMHYGAGTSRKRLVIRGIRRDVGELPPEPRRTAPTGARLRDVLDSLPVPSPPEELAHASLEGYATGRAWETLRVGETSEKYLQLIRCNPEKPLPGITAVGAHRGAANPAHPYECRHFTPTELAWAFGYPADYVWPGTPMQRYERIARSVAPPMYYAHGINLAAALGGKTL